MGKKWHQTHDHPVSRRTFLASGAAGVSATLFSKTVFGALRAGPTCPTTSGPAANTIPYLVFDLSGGAALPGNFLVGKAGGPEDLLASYNTLGWDPRASGALDKSFGVPMSAKFSQMLAGIKQTASAPAQACLRMGTLCNVSADDRGTNQLSAVTLISQCGYMGSLMPSGLGTINSNSGGNSDVIMTDLTLKPLTVNTLDDVLGAVSYGPALTGLKPAILDALGKALLGLSQQQAQKIIAQPLGQQLDSLTECGLQKNLTYTHGVTGLDPRQEAIFQKIYGITTSTATNDPQAIISAIVMNCLKGTAGPGVLTIGGPQYYDYHDGTQTTGDARDLEAGQNIGRAVEAAYQLGKPLFFHILTDGGISANTGTREWSSDSQERSMGVIGYMNPKGAPKQQRLQIGNFVDGQGVDHSTLIGTEPVKTGYAVFANYLNVLGRLGEFENYAPRGMFTPDQLNSLMVFG
jgi:hypothetical protein